MKLAPESLDNTVRLQDDGCVPAATERAVPEQEAGVASTLTTILLSNAVASTPIALDTVARGEASRPGDTQAVTSAALDIDVCEPEDAVYTGEALRRAREARGLTLDQIAERTRIGRQHIDNLEADRYDRLPAPVYIRGILMTLAKQLRLDGQKVARSYMEAIAAAQQAKPR